MKEAYCNLDKQHYQAANFEQLPPKELAQKRRHLVCIECGANAFFRKYSADNYEACFGARHVPGCSQATALNRGNVEPQLSEIEQILRPGTRIILDITLFAQQANDPEPAVAGVPHERPGGPGLRQGQGLTDRHHTLRSLLDLLINNPELRESENLIVIPDHPPIKIKDFFVPLLEVTAEHEGKLRGYWGQLAYVKNNNGRFWLNTGRPDSISFIADQPLMNLLYRYYTIEGESELRRAYVLVLAAPSVSRKHKVYCNITGQENISLQLAA